MLKFFILLFLALMFIGWTVNAGRAAFGGLNNANRTVSGSSPPRTFTIW